MKKQTLMRVLVYNTSSQLKKELKSFKACLKVLTVLSGDKKVHPSIIDVIEQASNKSGLYNFLASQTKQNVYKGTNRGYSPYRVLLAIYANREKLNKTYKFNIPLKLEDTVKTVKVNSKQAGKKAA